MSFLIIRHEVKSEIEKIAINRGFKIKYEVFGDRNYNDDLTFSNQKFKAFVIDCGLARRWPLLKSGFFTTNDKVVKRFEEDHPQVKEFRQLNKLINENSFTVPTTVEKEIKDLKKSSQSNISNIAAETSSEIIRQIINTEINKSNVSAIVNNITKEEIKKHI